MQGGMALESWLTKGQRSGEEVKDQGKSRTGGQYSCQYFTGRWTDSDLSVFSFSITTSTVGYLGNSEWILDTGATCHVYPNRDWFSNFEKLDICSAIMDDDRPCNMKGISTVFIKMFDGMVGELKKMRYFPQLKKILS